MRVTVTKLAGVESADVSLKKASADIRLKPDNRITMPQLRALLRQDGYPTRDAQIEARGRIEARGGKLVLDLLNGSTMDIDAKGVVLRPGDQIVEVTGVSQAEGKTAERLTVESIK